MGTTVMEGGGGQEGERRGGEGGEGRRGEGRGG